MTPLSPYAILRTVKQLFYTKRGDITLADVPAPDCGENEIVVSTHWSIISAGTETKPLKTTAASRAEKRRSLVKRGLEVLQEDGIKTLSRKIRDMDNLHRAIGYSAAGVVVTVGEDVSGFSVGDRVACAGAGYACHAEFIRVPPMLVTKVPPSVSLKDASWTTLGTIALQGFRRAAPQLGEVVVVTGLGLLGQITVQLLHAAGCHCIALDLDESRIEQARKHGADVALNARDHDGIRENLDRLSGGIGADAVLLCASTPSDDPMAQALELVRQRGRVVIVGDIGLKMPRSPFYQKEAEVTISCSYGPGRYDPLYEEGGLDYPPGFVRWTENRNMAAFLSMVEDGRIKLEPLTTHEFPIKAGEDAYRTLISPEENALGVVLRYPPAEPSELESDSRRVIQVEKEDTASGKIQIAMIGLGGFARGFHLPNIQNHPNLSLRYAVSRTGHSATREAKTFHASFASTDWQEVLKDPALDAVVICTRHDSHAEIARAALLAGKHVLVEKPIALTEAEIDAVVTAQTESGKVFLVGHNRRFSPAAQKLAEALRIIEGPSVIHMRINAGSIDASHWTQDPAIGGGRIIGEVCHFIDLCGFLVGDDLGYRVHSAAAVPTDGNQIHALDNVAFQLTFEDGSLADILYTSLGNKKVGKERIEVYAGGRIFLLDDFSSLQSFGPAPKATWNQTKTDKGHAAELDAFVRAIQGKEHDLPSSAVAARVGKAAIQINSLIRESHEGGTNP